MTCGGCRQSLSRSEPALNCSFSRRGFAFDDGIGCRPCFTVYHPTCFRVGSPFTCRRADEAGLRFPVVKHWPMFICEACTVRSVLDRELGGPNDGTLLQLERMRVLDMAHAWTKGTYSTYSSKLSYLQRFESLHGLVLLSEPRVDRPPNTRAISLMWAELAYSLKTVTKGGVGRPISFGTIRQLRSAAAQHMLLGWTIAKAGQVHIDSRASVVHLASCRPTDDGSIALFTKGLRSRLGDDPTPTTPLLDRHVRAMDEYFDLQWRTSVSESDKVMWARAGLANLLLWLGWLRATETFGLRWCDVTCIRPLDGPIHDLPPGMGCLLLRLSAETKSERGRSADVPIAYTTLSGYTAGTWYERLLCAYPNRACVDTDASFVFSTAAGGPWTSAYFRTTFIYPRLYDLQAKGDPYLRPFQGALGHCIPDKFPTLHMYRRGARTHVTRVKGAPRRRRATIDEIYEHARWRRSRSSEKIDVMYREWPLYDRLVITVMCH
jgi:hypothetical protein